MALEGPQLRYTQPRVEDVKAEDTLVRALELARKIEELLEDTRSVAQRTPVDDASTHATRMARAMAASLVDELEVLVRPVRRASTS